MHTSLRTLRAVFVASLSLLPTMGQAATHTLTPTADAFVQNGANAAKNYGTATTLRVQSNATAASNYNSYLKFDTATAVGQITSAKLRVYAKLANSGAVTSRIHAVSNTGWGETTITWNNQPILATDRVLNQISVTSTGYVWKEIDVTAYLQSERAANRPIASFAYRSDSSSLLTTLQSREGTNKPQLVIVTAQGNVAPTVSLINPANGSSSVSGQALVIEASAADSDGSIAQVEFLANGASLFTVTGLPYTLTTSLAAGSYTLTAKATDNLGAVTTSAPVNITVTPASNVLPTVSMTGPADGSSYTPPASINLNATAADSDGSITKVEFYNGGTLIGSATSAPYAFTWSNVPVGNYSVRARAIDNQGGATYSNTIAINVNTATASGVYYIYPDHLNTPRVITDSGNKVVWRWDSGPFGTDAANEDPDGDGVKFTYNPRFPGQYFDKETGLHYNYFRDYEPGTGRYVQSDPIGLAGGMNLYGYANQNPVMFTDPTGEFVLIIPAIPAAASGAAAGAAAAGAAAARVIPLAIRLVKAFCEDDDDINCDEWVKSLNMTYAQISAFKRAGGNTRFGTSA